MAQNYSIGNNYNKNLNSNYLLANVPDLSSYNLSSADLGNALNGSANTSNNVGSMTDNFDYGSLEALNSYQKQISQIQNQLASSNLNASTNEYSSQNYFNNLLDTNAMNSFNSLKAGGTGSCNTGSLGTGNTTGNVSKSDAQLTDSSKQGQLNDFKQHYAQNKSRYETVAAATGLPPELIAALHWRECSGDFSKTIKDGNSSVSNWEQDAIQVLKSEGAGGSGLTSNSKDLGKCCDFAEKYNGTGYRNKGVASPYVWSGTSKYTSGKYVADGVYDPNTKDQQLGVAVLMASIM